MKMQTWRAAWGRAEDASESIRAALASLGIPESVWSGIRPTVTYNGHAYVHMAMLPADTVEQMAEAMRVAEASAR
ncbi:hypothetical protein AB0M92_34840 [Streptomyces sp. NPDC051582]|uniref:hypothetical protein n=1 Tax=Streptomyces sp. NPDC051582 TaxID=3155167 RepID=UPI00343A2C0C